MENLPGVQSAAYSNSVPLSIDENTSTVYGENHPAPRAGESKVAVTYEVSPNFLATMGIQLLAGRDFNLHDDAQSPRVAIVNHAFGQKVFGMDNPLGKRFHIGSGTTMLEVVGVTEDGKYATLAESQKLAVFMPAPQQYNTTTTLIVRSALPEDELISRMRQAAEPARS